MAMIAASVQSDLQVKPLREGFAAVVSGIDVARVPDSDDAARLRALHCQYPVLAFADQDLTPASFVAFSQVFGGLEIDTHLTQFADPGFPELIYLTNVDKDGRPDPDSADRGSAWHSDSSYKHDPCAHTMLYALEIPTAGGGTLFADMYRAYETLPDGVRQRLEGRRAVHIFGGGPATGGIVPLKEGQKDLLPTVEQPVVRIHPETGRKALYVNPLHTAAIVGMEGAESDALLGFLFDHAVQPDFVYHHHWQVGEVVIWDQRCTMHRAEAAYAMTERRRLMRTKIAAN